MQKKLIYEGILLILIFGSIWGVFYLLPIWPKKTVSAISVEKEKKLGDILLKGVFAGTDFKEINNDTVEVALEAIKERLTAGLKDSKYHYNITLVSSEMANAFALPGGNIIITERLMAIMESPEECAAVLAHEMGHIEKRHTISKLLANFTAAVLFGDNALASEAAELLATSAYSRRQEEKADEFGLQLLEQSNVNPHIMGTAFRHLKKEADYSDIDMEIIMSHPDIESRIKNAYSYSIKENFTEVPIDINWKAVQNQFTHLKSL